MNLECCCGEHINFCANRNAVVVDALAVAGAGWNRWPGHF